MKFANDSNFASNILAFCCSVWLNSANVMHIYAYAWIARPNGEIIISHMCVLTFFSSCALQINSQQRYVVPLCMSKLN
jgi:hypothetical protein